MDAEDNNNAVQEQPDVELAGSAQRSSLGDFSQQEAAAEAAKKKRKYIIGGSIGLILIIIAIVLGVTLSGGNDNNANGNNSEEEQSNIKTENEPPILTQEPNVDEEPTTATVLVDPTVFSINDDTASYFTNGKAFNMAFDEDNAVYISVLDNDSSGNSDTDLVVTSIKESTFGPKHGECIISMGLDEVVYELTSPDFIGEDQWCVYFDLLQMICL